MSISVDGFAELVLEKAINLGVAKTKNEAIRMGLISFNKEYGLVKDIEMEMVARKLEKEQEKAKNNKTKFIPLDKALAKYK